MGEVRIWLPDVRNAAARLAFKVCGSGRGEVGELAG